MAKKLISTALAGLLLSAGAALAQPPDDHHDRGPERGQHGGPPPAPHAAPGPHAAPAAAPAPPPGALDRRDARDHRPGPQAAPQAQPAPRAAFRGAPAGGPGMAMRGPAGPHNFASFHRNFSSPHRFRAAAAYQRPRGWYAHRWTFGEVLPALFWAPDYWIDDYVDYGLMPPPPGTVWVRDGSDALLIARDDGEIIQVDYDVFY